MKEVGADKWRCGLVCHNWKSKTVNIYDKEGNRVCVVDCCPAEDETNLNLIKSAEDHALFAAGVVQGIVRWEFFAGDQSGEICVGGIRYSTDLDEFGVPIISDSVREEIRELLRIKGG